MLRIDGLEAAYGGTQVLDGDSTVMFDNLTMPQSTRLVPVENGAFHIDDRLLLRVRPQRRR